MIFQNICNCSKCNMKTPLFPIGITVLLILLWSVTLVNEGNTTFPGEICENEDVIFVFIQGHGSFDLTLNCVLSPLHISSRIIFPTPSKEIEGQGRAVASEQHGQGFMEEHVRALHRALCCRSATEQSPAALPTGLRATSLIVLCGEGVILQLVPSLPHVEPARPLSSFQLTTKQGGARSPLFRGGLGLGSEKGKLRSLFAQSTFPVLVTGAAEVNLTQFQLPRSSVAEGLSAGRSLMGEADNDDR